MRLMLRPPQEGGRASPHGPTQRPRPFSLPLLVALAVAALAALCVSITPCAVGAASSSSSHPPPLVYRSSLSLMHPLVADVFRLRVESEAPLQWADVHYAVLQADEAEWANNQTALRQRQINFMMQSESNTAFVLNYVRLGSEHSGRAQRSLCVEVRLSLTQPLMHRFVAAVASVCVFTLRSTFLLRPVKASLLS